MKPVSARFDSLDAAGRSLEFRGLLETVVAERLDRVLPALRRLEEAVAAGHHAAGFLAYEAAPAFDRALRCHPGRPDLPLLWFGIFAERAPALPLETPADDACTLGPWEPGLTRAEYERRAEAVREWIAAGDTYQVNLTFPLRARFHGSDEALYARLCRSQRSGYCAFLRLPDVSIVSASPELFFRWRGSELELRPMKGTRPRGRWPEEDRALAAELLSSEKERAENLMIVDLLRNDAGRIAEFGSVRVERLFELESYPTVHQLTSTIRARTRAGVGISEILRALFPSGSVTGAPKVRTMELITELEDGPRGVYTGALGFLSDDEAVFNVPIRTVVLRRKAGEARLGVGSGVTYDSRPGAEYEECLQKASFTRGELPDVDLLESLAHRPEEGFAFLQEHLARLAASAERFGFAFREEEVRRRLAQAVAEREEPSKVRLLLSRDGSVSVECEPLGAAPAVLKARIAAEPVESSDPLLYHKTTRRGPYQRRLAAHPGCDEVILRNERGELTELTVGNLVVRRGGVSLTPPLRSGLLPGVLRSVLLERGQLTERVLWPEDLLGADGVYRINSVRGWTPVDVEPEG